MAHQILQYQRLAQPLEPSLTTAPPELSWYFQHPPQPPPRRRTAHYLPYESTVDSTTFQTTIYQVAPVIVGSLVKEQLFLYQAKAEPIERSLFEAPPETSWAFQFPSKPPPQARTAHYLPYEKTVEPSLYVTPALDSWYVQHPTKPPDKPRAAYFLEFTYVAEPTVYFPPDESPDLDGWVQPISQPLFRRQPVSRNPYFQEYTRPLEPSYLFTPGMDTWYVQHPTRPPDRERTAEYLPVALVIEDTALGEIADPDGWILPIVQPLFDKEPAAHYLPYDGPLEQTLYQTPTIGWDVQHFNPVLPAKRTAHYLPYEKTVEPSLYVTPTMDTWYVQHPRRPLYKIPPTEFLFVTPTLQTGPVDGLDTFVVVVDGSDSAAYAVEASDAVKYRVTGSDGSY